MKDPEDFSLIVGENRNLKVKNKALELYLANPSYCKNCNKVIEPKDGQKPSSIRNIIYCSKDCYNIGIKKSRKGRKINNLDYNFIKLKMDEGMSYRGVAKLLNTTTDAVRYCAIKNKHNLKQIIRYGTKEGQEVKCKSCDRIYIKDRNKGHKGDMCNSCHTSRVVLRKIKIVNNIIGEVCCRCGYNKCAQAIEYHHVFNKQFTISTAFRCKSEKSLIEECKKCIPLCSNCHREFHYNIWNYLELDLSNLNKYQVDIILKYSQTGKGG